MKNIGLKVKAKLVGILSNNISPLFIEKRADSQVSESTKRIGILPKQMYLSMDRRYKVISKKELLAIVENEKLLRSPFKQSYVLYRVDSIGDGEWNVKFYFVDLEAHPEVLQYKMLLLWEEIANFLLKKESLSVLRVSSCWGAEKATLNEGKVHLSSENAKSLKNKILNVENHGTIKEMHFDDKALHQLTVDYLVTFAWWEIAGTFNKQAFNQSTSTQFLQQINYKFLGYAVIAAVLLESGFLIASTQYLNNQIDSNAELRQSYSQLKRNYNNLLERYGHYAEAESKRSYASDVPKLLGSIDTKAGLRIDRFDYIQGEVRIGGLVDDVDLFVGYLSEQKRVKQLEFISPIKPDKSGKDRFAIKFEFIND
ncbi:hypothetical protein [Alteromonas sp. a30]|uniref:hypothetical protein n=1 Tax=Alteromonas sp. a30 TaxID=2730917 RepID=UPI00228291C8|nr:hypothetical protein [Alteromonas sp. a30]MCY7294375.1 hypothetical protein [Alteromonas sp. a30]